MKKPLLILIEVTLILLQADSFIRYGLPADYLYWITAVAWTALGYVTYRAHRRALQRKDKASNILYVFLFLLGFAGPYAFSYIEPLRYLARGSRFWWISLFGFMLYLSIKNPKELEVAVDPKVNMLRRLKILHTLAIGFALVVMILAVFFPRPYVWNLATKPELKLVLAATYIPILAFFFMGIWSWRLGQRLFGFITATSVQAGGYVARSSLLSTPSGLGLFLWWIGASWELVIALPLASAVALLLTFPAKERFEKWKDR